MKINGINNTQLPQKKQNFKSNSTVFDSFFTPSTYQPVTLNVLRAYTTYQTNQNYKEIKTFDIPYVGQGKLYQLSNGHKLAVISKPGPTVISTTINAGQEDSPVISHFLEHLLYNSENQIDKENFASLQKNLGLDVDATTNLYNTNYVMKYPFSDDENIEKIVKTQAQLLQYPPNFKTKVETEKGVLVSEATMYPEEKNDEETINYRMLNELFGINEKPKPIINKIEKIKNSTYEELIAFHNKYYNNNNMTSVVVGDVNPDQIARTFAKNFNKPNNSPIKNTKVNLSKPIQQTKRIDLKFNSSNSEIENNIQVGFVGPKNDNIEENFLYIALKFYFNNIKQDENIFLEGLDTKHLSVGNSIIKFSSKSKPKEEEIALKELYQNIFNLTQNQISDNEITILKSKLKESFSEVSEGAYPIAHFCSEEFSYSNNIDLFEYSKLADKLTKQSLQAFTQKYFDLNKAVVIVAHKNEESKKANSPTFTGSKSTLNTTGITEYKYPNNLQLTLDTSPGISRTSFRLKLISDENPKTKPGISRILEFMLMESEKDYELKYPYSSKPHLNVKLNKVDLEASTQPENTKEIINLVKSKLLTPSFTQEELDKAKKLLKADLEVNSDKDLMKIKQAKFANYAYRDSIYNTSFEDACKLVDEITLADVRDFHKQLISKSQGKAILVMPKSVFESQKNDIFRLIGSEMPILKQKQEVNLAAKISVPSLTSTKIITNEIKDENAQIQQGFQISRNGVCAEDLGVKLISTILGEQRDSRLVGEIREKQGLSYSTGTLLDSDDRPSYLYLISNLPLNKDNSGNIKKIMDVYKKNIDDLVNNPISEKELENAKTIIKSNIVQNLEYTEGRNDLIDEYGTENAKNLFQIIDKITPNDIQNLAKRYLMKPSIIQVRANKDVLSENKNYLSSLGTII